MPGSAWLLQRLGITKGRRSEYDRIMLRLHDTGKLDAAYQSGAPRADVAFAAGTTWLCFTDQVLHAALAGHCALEQTFHLPVDGDGASGAFAAAGAGAAGRPRADIAQPIGGQSGIVPPRDQRDGAAASTEANAATANVADSDHVTSSAGER